jgi:glutamate-5-semialdehyde dehydrogenase
MNPSTASATYIESLLRDSREASYQLAVLTTQQKNQVLEKFAILIDENTDFLLAENHKDLEAQEGQIAPSLYQRLKLDRSKVQQLVQGIRDVVNLPDPVGQVLSKTRLDSGLILEKMTVPLGVIGIVFESRPDVIPQILSLVLKSGNAVVLKGGSEAKHSNYAFMTLVEQLQQSFPWLPAAWAQLVDTRQAVQEMLAFPQYVDLVIPRGSNQLVQSIMAATKIPVLGHADGVCHVYVHQSANLDKAVKIAVDAKAQYPAACNAAETLLVDEPVAEAFLPRFTQEASRAGITLKGCDRTRQILPQAEVATEEDWHTEYGDLTLSVKVVPDIAEAINHINSYGSHHTETIIAENTGAQETFLNSVDSAGVFSNASTRFADGFRYGLGAEIGISTAKTHARGPVGLEGLVIYKYKLRGNGQVVSDYVGENPRPFLHDHLCD